MSELANIRSMYIEELTPFIDEDGDCEYLTLSRRNELVERRGNNVWVQSVSAFIQDP